MLKVNTVCVNGMGSSLILRMTVEKALKELNINAQVTAIDFSGFQGMKPHLCITTPELAKSIKASETMIVLTIINFTDVQGIKQKIADAINLYPFLKVEVDKNK